MAENGAKNGTSPYVSRYVSDMMDAEAKQYHEALEEFKNRRANPIEITPREHELLEAIVDIFVPVLTTYYPQVKEGQWEINERVVRRELEKEIARHTKVVNHIEK